MQPDKSHMEEAKVSVIIRSARSALGASQGDLAMELDVSQSSIARLERGVGTIPATVLLRAIRYFSGCGIDIIGILEDDPQIKFSESFFQEMVERERESKRQLAASAMKKRLGEKPEGSPK